MSDESKPVGFGKPPESTRFRKGQSGNPRGRPRGRRPAVPHDAVLGQKVTIRENGVAREVTAAEAFLLHMARRGLEGDSSAARASMEAIAQARAARGPEPGEMISTILVSYVEPGSVEPGLRALRMATRLDRFRPTSRTVIEPWLVQLALARLGDRRLDRAEQHEVVRATRTPKKVKWPPWWTELP